MFQITWIDGLGNVVTKRSPSVDIHYYVEQIPESRLYTAKSILTIRPKKEHHNTTFICQAQNAADRTYQSTKILLLVKYAPKVNIRQLPPTSAVILTRVLEFTFNPLRRWSKLPSMV